MSAAAVGSVPLLQPLRIEGNPTMEKFWGTESTEFMKFMALRVPETEEIPWWLIVNLQDALEAVIANRANAKIPKD